MRLPCSADVEMSRIGDCWATVTYKWGCTVYSVQCKMYCKVVLLSFWREPQCSSVWGVKLFIRLLLCLTPPEDSRAVVGDLEMERNGVSHPFKKGILDLKESSLVPEGFLTAQLLQKLEIYETFCCDVF